MAVETSPLLQHNPPLCCMFPSILYLPKWLNLWLVFDASRVSFTVDVLKQVFQWSIPQEVWHILYLRSETGSKLLQLQSKSSNFRKRDV